MTDRRKGNTGKYNTGNYNTGNYNTGGCNTGYRNTGGHNTGYRNTGYRNTGNYNTGNRNTGNYNTGNRNTGNRNTGNRNTGDHNTGDWNTGDWNTGDWNTTDRETGYFNTIQSHSIRVFNKTISKTEWEEVCLPDWLYFDLTEWVPLPDMTTKEREEHPEHVTTGGYMREYTYKEAFQKAWDESDPVDREHIREIPGFDAEIFYEISGIDLRGSDTKELTVAEVSELLGYEVKIVK